MLTQKTQLFSFTISGYFLVLSFLLSHNIAKAQGLPKAEVLSIADGLDFREVRGITQDYKGLLWIATAQGLNKYDGYRFIVYDDKPDNPNHIPATDIEGGSLYYRPDSTIWFLAGGQIQLLDLNTNACRSIPSTNHLPLPRRAQVVYHFQDADQILVVAEDQQFQYLQKYQRNDHFVTIDSLPRGVNWFTSIATDTLGQIYWSTIDHPIYQYDRHGRRLDTLENDQYDWYGHRFRYTLSYIDQQNRHFLFPKSRNAIDLWNDSTASFEPFLQMPKVVYHALEDQQGNLWFATLQQLFRFQKDGKLTDYSHSLQSSNTYSVINSLYEDSSNNLWVGTDNGLIKLSNERKLFTNYLYGDQSRWANTIRAIFEEPGGKKWAMCESAAALYYMDTSATDFQKFHTYAADGSNINLLENAKYFVPGDQASIVYTFSKNLLNVDLESGQIQIVKHPQRDFTGEGYNPIIRLASGPLLMGGRLQDLCMYHLDSAIWSPFFAAPITENPDIKILFESKAGHIWVGTTTHGLYQLDSKGQLLNHFHSASTPRLNNNHILSLAEDTKGGIWVGTFGGGLHLWSAERDNIASFIKDDGLADNNVTGILPYGEEYLWISTYNGLSCFHQLSKTFQNFFEEDGLTHNEFNYTSYFKDKSGNYFFGGMNGINAFDPEAILFKASSPPMCFTEITRYNRRADTKSTRTYDLDAIDQLIISPFDNYFQVHWTLPDYFKPDQNQYYTWLEGYEKDWTYQRSSPFVRYNKLPAGSYILHIKGADSRGNWSTNQLKLPILVKPFFFQTWWFIGLLALLLGGSIYGIFQYRLQQLLEMERLRVKIASDLHDEVGSMLSGLAMHSELVSQSVQGVHKSKLQLIADMSRSAMGKLRDLVWAIDSRRERVADLVDRMREFAEEMLIPKEIAYTLQTYGLSTDNKLAVDIRQHLYLIYKEAITNIIKHSNADQVAIQLGNQTGYFELIIKDNGTVSQKAYTSTGQGLSNMQMRAKKLNAELQIDQQDGFVIRLKMKEI